MQCSPPHLECRLELTKWDVLEDSFSNNGQWIRNHHNYSFCQMQEMFHTWFHWRKSGSIDLHTPEFAKPPKARKHQVQTIPGSFAKADWEGPAVDAVIKTWKEWIVILREVPISVGMVLRKKCCWQLWQMEWLVLKLSTYRSCNIMLMMKIFRVETTNFQAGRLQTVIDWGILFHLFGCNQLPINQQFVLDLYWLKMIKTIPFQWKTVIAKGNVKCLHAIISVKYLNDKIS